MDLKNKKLIFDAFILISCFIFAVYLIKSGLLDIFTNKILFISFVPEIIAGVLFTSFLTSPLSVATIYTLSDHLNPIQIALLGGVGAAFGDMLIIKIFRDNLFTDFHTLSRDLKLQKLFHFFKVSHFNHLAPLFGILIVASPFPDEVGLMLLGASRLKNFQLLILTYVLNSIGILIIALSSNFFK